MALETVEDELIVFEKCKFNWEVSSDEIITDRTKFRSELFSSSKGKHRWFLELKLFHRRVDYEERVISSHSDYRDYITGRGRGGRRGVSNSSLPSSVVSLGRYGEAELYLYLNDVPKSPIEAIIEFTLEDGNGDTFSSSGFFVFSAYRLSTFRHVFDNSIYVYDTKSIKISVSLKTRVDRQLINQDPKLNDYNCRSGCSCSSAKVLSDLESLLKTGNFTDVIIAVEDKKIQCHKCIIASRSPYFAALFDSNLRESTENLITITDFAADIIQNMINFLYTSRLPELALNAALQLLKAADKYQVLDLKEMCEGQLAKLMDQSNVFSILLFSDMCLAVNLKNKAVEFACKNMSSFKDEQYDMLLKEGPHLLKELLIAKAAL